ncbi:YheC/YheD family protein [Paenibacillus sp. sgz500958]|uniref:YheC/YheD family protein n=1 Tax=Paenibacillus sp. sgz500958 TaxID=3242475 RepID=UPI0036D29471
MRIQRVSSKWAKTKAILRNHSLSAYIPDTRKYEFSVLNEMLDLYNVVYIKPDRGTYGNGVMRAEQRTVNLTPSPQNNDTESEENKENETKLVYILRQGKTAEIFNTTGALDEAIKKLIKDRPYLIQKGIELLQHHNRPFDLRVLVQKNPLGAWETTGMLGRVAAPHKIVTNYHNGGRIKSVKPLLSEHMNTANTTLTMNQLRTLGIQMAWQLESVYSGIKEIGLDVAIDEHHDLWVLEINTLPSIVIFKIFPDKSIYRKIHRYAASYGRVKNSSVTTKAVFKKRSR